MTLDELRRQMEAFRRAVEREARAFKDPNEALVQLRALYERFDVEERELADMVLAEWALSDDEGIRFEAMVLIDEFKIRTARHSLLHLATRLSHSDAPGAPFELQKIQRILGRLEAPAAT
jgi:hypothetical protein